MTTAVQDRPASLDRVGGGAPARRAVIRWAWRLFRREWRRQMLVLALLTLAVAATTIGLAIASNTGQLGPDPTFGTANTIISITPGADLSADIAAVRDRFPTADVVAHQSIAVPGSVATVDLRAENPAGTFLHPTVRLDSGHYPTAAGQVAITPDVAHIFNLHLGDRWAEGGRNLEVVGLVENPLNLLDHFALVPPGQADPADSVSVLVNASQQDLQSVRLPSGTGLNIDSRGTTSTTQAETLVLMIGTVGLLFVGLLAGAGFAVMAQRRLRALGMLASVGATDRQVRLVMLANGAAVGATAALAGLAAGLGGWLAFAPGMASILNRRIDRFNLPWWAIAVAAVLAVVTAVIAAWWPARTVARIPIVAALSGRPPRPQPAHRFAAVGVVLFAAGLLFFTQADRHNAAYNILGTIATVVGLLFLAPLAVAAIARLAGAFPVAVRLALRDLARYQARSGAALGAATLAVGIAATIAISAGAAQKPVPFGNLATNQVNIYVGPQLDHAGNPVPALTPSQLSVLQADVNRLAGTLHAPTPLEIDAAVNPQSTPQTFPGSGGQPGGQVAASLARVTFTSHGEGIEPVASLYVASASLLASAGVSPNQIDPSADVISSRTDLQGLQIFLPEFGAPGSSGGKRGDLPHPTIQRTDRFPRYTSDPNTLLTAHAMATLGLQARPAGWFIQTPQPLTAAQITTARTVAASAGMVIETKSAPKSSAALRNWATAIGIL
ncbi:MAG TPA: FtsX-like permease family protein, partial [Acidimicrobiales bacterium]|nr:FtsX-like permease family protein [Acidimicrobiales bacterium]